MRRRPLVRQVCDEAWRPGIEHCVQLAALGDSDPNAMDLPGGDHRRSVRGDRADCLGSSEGPRIEPARDDRHYATYGFRLPGFLTSPTTPLIYPRLAVRSVGGPWPYWLARRRRGTSCGAVDPVALGQGCAVMRLAPT
ncbi:hypothetical protein [Streptomyces olivochromogenes]|uniref:hypothetical protein n=1 Tax=Streptomyces olivochromogenes TaxID=1963 RepID=UPI001F35DA5F|nr:hypothetical protein [Streptomyces olivochromogenes]MCF3137108.1 hypothetical protein [Streptomyces olivochromogenes]